MGDMPEVPLSRRQALAAAALILLALLLAGRFLLGAGAASAEPVLVEPLRAEPAPPLVVHVVGAVAQPGLYRLPRGKRVADAVELAGGATAKAALDLINLAAPVADGQQVVVPARMPAAAGSAGAGARAPTGPLSLSSATLEQLDALPGIGPATAQKILAYRSKHGGFRSVQELDAVPGIGPARLEQLQDLVAP